MKICRFNGGKIGIARGDRVFDVTSLAMEKGRGGEPWAEPVLSALDLLQSASAYEIEAGESCELGRVRLQSPLRAPGKIIGAPVNYRAHVQEMVSGELAHGHLVRDALEAGLFLKATSSLVGPSDGVDLRFPDRRTDHEVELVAVIGKTAAQVAQESALDHVAGYCIGLDITLRGPEDRSFRKSIDSYSVLGPWLTSADEIPDPQALRLTLRNNGQLRQDASTADMIHGVAKLIAFASQFYTLHPGDVLFTGTPSGVEALRPGDRLDVACDGLGHMSVAVR